MGKFLNEHIWEPIKAFLPRLAIAAVIVLLGLLIQYLLLKWLNKLLAHRIDKTMHAFIRSTVKILLWIVVVLMAASSLGLDTGSLLAVLASAGVAIGLALKDSLSNIASGMLIIASKNFKSGDYIELEDGAAGSIDSVDLIYTTINSSDNKRIVIPNSVLAGNIVTNYSHNELRRVDMNFSIGYNDSIAKAREIISGLIDEAPGALKDPAPLVEVLSQDASAIKLTTRIWCKKDDYWNVYFFMNEQVKLAFDREGITIPFNQLDVTVHSADKD